MESQRYKAILEFEKAKRELFNEFAKGLRLKEIVGWLTPKAEWINKKIDKLMGRQ